MGYARFHLNLAEKKEASFSDLFSQFSRITDGVAMVFVRGFYIYCWTCLFFVPGFIKTYSYAMTPYVLMEHPEYSANEAITESRRLMDGRKWNLFCLTFSFIGWRLICSIQYITSGSFVYTGKAQWCDRAVSGSAVSGRADGTAQYWLSVSAPI